MNEFILGIDLIDDFTGKKIKDEVIFDFENISLKASKNRSGYFIIKGFYNEYEDIKIKSTKYFSKSIKVNKKDLKNNLNLITVNLIPNPYYEFPVGSTVIRMNLSNKDASKIKAFFIEDVYAVGKLLKNTDENNELLIKDGKNLLNSADEYIILDENKVQKECIYIKKIHSQDDVYYRKLCTLKENIKGSYKKGSNIFKMYTAQLNKNKEAVIYLKKMLSSNSKLQIYILGKKEEVMEVMVEEGKELITSEL